MKENQHNNNNKDDLQRKIKINDLRKSVVRLTTYRRTMILLTNTKM